MTQVQQLDGWIPIRLYWQEAGPVVDWCFFGDQRFVDPFFSQTVEVALRGPCNLLFRHQTPIDALDEWGQSRPGLSPDGFIFHMSRSGSTLVAQTLAALSTNLVISEAAVIDSAVRSYLRSAGTSEERRIEWLRSIINALGQPRANEKHYIIKFDAWNTLDLPLIRRAFPRVPWVFVYRDPMEVMVSQFDQRGAHTIPGVLPPGLFGMDLQSAVSMPPEEYCARVLATICNAALQFHREGGQLINYSELPEIVWNRMLEFFGIDCSESELDALRVAARRDAKSPLAIFQSDAERKRQRASEAVRAAADKWLYPVYEQLEAARQTQQPVT
jgi:gluconate kinase